MLRRTIGRLSVTCATVLAMATAHTAAAQGIGAWPPYTCSPCTHGNPILFTRFPVTSPTLANVPGLPTGGLHAKAGQVTRWG